MSWNPFERKGSIGMGPFSALPPESEYSRHSNPSSAAAQAEAAYPMVLRGVIRAHMPAFLKKAFPQHTLLTIVHHENGKMVRSGWLPVPHEDAKWKYNPRYFGQIFLIKNCEVALCTVGSVPIVGIIPEDVTFKFGDFADRVVLQEDLHICWPSWNKENIHVIPDDELASLKGREYPFNGSVSSLLSMDTVGLQAAATATARWAAVRRLLFSPTDDWGSAGKVVGGTAGSPMKKGV